MNVNTGVYRIKNNVDGKFYIGSSINEIQNRWYGHRRKLNKGSHENKYLQQAWNTYKEDSFTFEIVENVTKSENILEREQHWIDSTNCLDRDIGYNINPKASNGAKRVINFEALRNRDASIQPESNFTPNYKPLEIALIKGNKTRQNLKEDLGISGATLAKIKKREFISLQVVAQLCEYLDVQIQEIVFFGEDLIE